MKHLTSKVTRLSSALLLVALLASACGAEPASVSESDAATDPVASDNAASGADEANTDQPPANQPSTAPTSVTVSSSPTPTAKVEPDTEVPVGNYPSFVGTLSDGATFEMASLAGEDVILWFWAPW